MAIKQSFWFFWISLDMEKYAMTNYKWKIQLIREGTDSTVSIELPENFRQELNSAFEVYPPKEPEGLIDNILDWLTDEFEDWDVHDIKPYLAST